MSRFKFSLILCLLLLLLLVGCQKETKTVCLFFDDGWQNQYDVVLPILLKYDFKATFGVITGSIGTGKDIYRYMGEKELKELAKYGMDIACHTKTHPNLTKNLSDEQLREEIVYSKKYLEKLGFKVRTFVYPYYEWNDITTGYVKEAGYVCARGGLHGTYNLETKDPGAKYHIPSYPIVGQNLEQFQQIVAKAGKHSVVCLVYHFISDVGPAETSTPVRNFSEQMRYLKETGFNVVLLPDLFK